MAHILITDYTVYIELLHTHCPKNELLLGNTQKKKKKNLLPVQFPDKYLVKYHETHKFFLQY